MEVMGIHMALGMNTAILYLMVVSAMGMGMEIMDTAMNTNIPMDTLMGTAMGTLMVRIIVMMTILLKLWLDPANRFCKVYFCTLWQTHWEVLVSSYLLY